MSVEFQQLKLSDKLLDRNDGIVYNTKYEVSPGCC
jgi:hypothetical protein